MPSPTPDNRYSRKESRFGTDVEATFSPRAKQADQLVGKVLPEAPFLPVFPGQATLLARVPIGGIVILTSSPLRRVKESSGMIPVPVKSTAPTGKAVSI